MAAEIRIMGKINKHRKVTYQGKKINSFEINIGGSENAPKKLPLSSRNIHYSCLLNDKQFDKLRRELHEIGIPHILGQQVFLRGEITIDLPMDIIQGEIGVIVFEIGSIEVERIKREKQREAALIQQQEKT